MSRRSLHDSDFNPIIVALEILPEPSIRCSDAQRAINWRRDSGGKSSFTRRWCPSPDGGVRWPPQLIIRLRGSDSRLQPSPRSGDNLPHAGEPFRVRAAAERRLSFRLHPVSVDRRGGWGRIPPGGIGVDVESRNVLRRTNLDEVDPLDLGIACRSGARQLAGRHEQNRA